MESGTQKLIGGVKYAHPGHPKYVSGIYFIKIKYSLYNSSDSGTLTTRTVTFCDFLSNFRKNTAKNPTKPGNSAGQLHFFTGST